MKNLFFKEIKLSIHPLCYVFCILAGLLGLIPSYPPGVAFIYTNAAYTMLFLGVNKAASTNDLLYSVNLPLRRRDIVKARLCSISFLQFTTLIILLLSLTVSIGYKDSIAASSVIDGETTVLMSLDVRQIFAFIGIILVGFTIQDSIFVPWFYKTGKSILGPTLVSTLFSTFYFIGVPTALAYMPSVCDMLTVGSENANYLLQFGILILGIISYVLSRLLINKISGNLLEKVDF